MIVVTVGIDGLHVRQLSDLDPYLVRPHRLYTGIVSAPATMRG
jgi:hypothetical protein